MSRTLLSKGLYKHVIQIEAKFLCPTTFPPLNEEEQTTLYKTMTQLSPGDA